MTIKEVSLDGSYRSYAPGPKPVLLNSPTQTPLSQPDQWLGGKTAHKRGISVSESIYCDGGDRNHDQTPDSHAGCGDVHREPWVFVHMQPMRVSRSTRMATSSSKSVHVSRCSISTSAKIRREGEDESQSTIFFRRLATLYFAGSVTKNWLGKVQFDLGKSLDGDEVAVKDAYMQYTGFKNLKIFIGSSKTVFSREFLASSKRQQTVERWFVGQHNFGSPDRMLGFRVDGNTDNKKFEYKLNVGGQSFDPDNRRMDFDNPAND